MLVNLWWIVLRNEMIRVHLLCSDTACLVPGRDKRFLASEQRSGWLWGPLSLLFKMVPGALSFVVEAAGKWSCLLSVHTIKPTIALKQKITFLYTNFHNSDMVRSIVIVFRELLSRLKMRYTTRPPLHKNLYRLQKKNALSQACAEV
jgi:hypothetical protein